MIELLIPEATKLVGTYTTPNPTHKHFKWELTLFEKGGVINYINGVSYKVNEGDVFLLGPPHLHAIELLTPKHVHRDIYFEESVVESVLDIFLGDAKKDVISGKQIITASLDVQDFNSILKNINNLENLCLIETLNKDNSEFKTAKAVAQSILHYVFGIYVTKSRIKQMQYPEWFYTFLNDLNKHEFFTKNVTSLIAETNYSHTQFGKIFKKFCGFTLVDYLKNLRLSYACELLDNTDHTTLFICENCGYNSYSYFERTFKEKFGCTPNQYRNKIQTHKIVSANGIRKKK